MKMKAYASFDDFVEGQTAANQALMRELRKLVRSVAPGLVETVKWGNGCWVKGKKPVAFGYCGPDHVQFGFFGARGVTIEEGLTDVNLSEVTMKRAMVERCRRVVGVADARKWGHVAAATFARLDQVHEQLVEDARVPAQRIAERRAALDRVLDVFEDVRERGFWLLIRQDLEALDQG